MPLAIRDPNETFPWKFEGSGGGRAYLRRAINSDVAVWKRTWQPRLLEKKEVSAQWDWQKEVLDARLLNRTCVALGHEPESWPKRYALRVFRSFLQIDVRETALDGLISLSTVPDDASSRFENGKRLVYIEYVSAAPHNRKAYGPPLWENVGNILYGLAIKASRALGYDGRIGLHSTADAVKFYRDKMGLRPGSYERHDGVDWLYFEGSPEWARRYLPEGIER